MDNAHVYVCKYDHFVDLYFNCCSDLCARNSSSNGVMKIVRMLNELYTTFDVLADSRSNPNIYKVTNRTDTQSTSTLSGIVELVGRHLAVVFRTALNCIDLIPITTVAFSTD